MLHLSCTLIDRMANMNVLDSDRSCIIIERLQDGMSVRAVARLVGVSPQTVLTHRRLMKELDAACPDDPPMLPELCECGGITGHHGWCSVRFRASMKRQAFMAKWRTTPPA